MEPRLLSDFKMLKNRIFISVQKQVKPLCWALLFCIFSAYTVRAQDQPVKTRILFLLDASGSMVNPWQGSSRLIVAKKVLNTILDSVQKLPSIETGLRVFGSLSPLTLNDCKDTKLEAPIRTANGNFIKSKLSSLNAKGITPITYALQQAGKDFGVNTERVRNIIILITDGIESCGGDPCQLSFDLQKKGIVLKPFIVGLGITPEAAKTFECMGKYNDAESEGDFMRVMKNVVNTILKNTTTQVNLLDINNLPTETNVNMVFYDALTGLPRYNYVHTLNTRGKPDTLNIDPINNYDLIVYSRPPVEKKNITIAADKHNIISVPVPQGDLLLTIGGIGSSYKDLQGRVSIADASETLDLISVNAPKKFIVGEYDVEILTLPRIKVRVKVKQSETTTIQVPSPGLITLLNTNNVPVYAGIYQENGFDLDWVCNLNGNSPTETITLQPGNYRLVYKTRGSKKAMTTEELKFKISSGSSDALKLF